MKTDFEINTELDIARHIDFVDGKLMAKKVLDCDNGKVMLLAFDKGVETGNHSVDACVMVQVLEGEVNFEINGAIHAMKAGQQILMEPNTIHNVQAVSCAKVFVTRINCNCASKPEGCGCQG